METIIINALFLLVWTLLGSLFGMITFMFSVIVFPIFFLFTSHYSKNISVFILSAFLTFLLGDYLFRLFGGGIHDDAGRCLCNLVFYITYSTTTIAIFTVNVIAKQSMKYKIFNGVLILVLAMISYCVFIHFLVNI